MDKSKLKRYKKNQNRLKRIDERIDYLCQKDVEVVSGKVFGSSLDFPYTQVGTTVQMYQPEENDKVNKEIREKQAERILVMGELEEVESFISSIEDGEIREIFELSFMGGVKQQEVADTVGYSRGRISQIISSYLKD